MARPKVAVRPRKREKGITIKKDAYETKAKDKATKLHRTGGKGKGKEKTLTLASSKARSNIDDMYSSHLTTSESEFENQEH